MAKDNAKLDVAILGAGPAGMSAAIWCHELGLTAALFEKTREPGGQLLRTYNPIKNYPGVNAKNGCELRDHIANQLVERGIKIVQDNCVEADLNTRSLIFDSGREIRAASIIIATGVRRRRLNIPGEKQLAGRGVLESGANAGDAVTGKKVVIVGGGDAALENALILSGLAKEVTVVHRGPKLRARDEFIAKASKNDKIQFIFNSTVASIMGGEGVEAVQIDSADGQTILDAENILIRIGVVPNSEIFREQLRCDDDGYIEIDRQCRASIENVFAIGDLAHPGSPTIATAVGSGATAAKCVSRFATADNKVSKVLNILEKNGRTKQK